MSHLSKNKILQSFGSEAVQNIRRLIAENNKGKFKNYLRVNIKGIQNGKNRYGYCLFVPNKTKLTIQKGEHYEMNELIKVIKLPKFHNLMFAMAPYKKLEKEILDQIEEKPEKKMILLKAT